jgi:hypothetical protein
MTAAAGSPKKLARLVSTNNYKYADRISPLVGSINDVEDMRQLLIGKFEFSGWEHCDPQRFASGSRLHPEEKGAEEVLKPGSTLPRTLTTFLKRGLSSVTMFWRRLPASSRLIWAIEQGQIGGIGDGITDDPLQELLDDSVSGTLGVMNQALNLGTWTTVQRVLLVKRLS